MGPALRELNSSFGGTAKDWSRKHALHSTPRGVRGSLSGPEHSIHLTVELVSTYEIVGTKAGKGASAFTVLKR